MELDFPMIAEVDRLYAGLMLCAGSDGESGAGGKLLYAGELDADGRALVVAGNIAGAASLAATADALAQKQAIRDGTADFLVTSLDEALRILKNQVRKHEAGAVCVALAPETVQRQMLEIGVLPDLLPARLASDHQCAAFIRQGSRRFDLAEPAADEVVLTWGVGAAPARWLPMLDAVALDCLNPAEFSARRWLRLAPRYLGRTAQNLRLLRCGRASAARFIEQARENVECGKIQVPVEMQLNSGDRSELYLFSPQAVRRFE